MPKFSAGRRRFALGAAAAATTALIAPAEALIHKGHLPMPPQAGGPEKTLEQRAHEAIAKLTPQAQAEVEAKFTNIIRKYGSRLNDEQKLDIRRSLAETQDGLEKMRQYALENGDEPATVFQNFRGEK